MYKEYSGKKISLNTIKNASQGNDAAMREVMYFFNPYIVSLSMENGIFNRELYERLVCRLMIVIAMKFRLDYEEK